MATFTNFATLTYGDNTVNSNIVTGEIRDVLSATKDPLPDSYTTGDIITYVVSIINSGDSDFAGLTVTDDLGAYTLADGTTVVYPLNYIADSVRFYIDGILQTAPTTEGGPPLVISGIAIPANSNGLLIYQARANEFAPLSDGSTIINNATVSGDGICQDIVATATIALSTEPELSITKALEPTVVPCNGTVTYTFTISNYGTTAAVATDSVILTDTVDPIIDITSVTINGVATTAYTYNTTTGLFRTNDGTITVPAATATQNENGSWTVTPGTTTLVVTGTL